MKPILCITVLALTLGLGAGCGDDSESSSDSEKVAYIQQLSDLRVETDAMIEQFSADAEAVSSLDDLRRILVPVSETSSSVLDELESIDPPQELEEVHELALSVNERQAATADDVIAAIDSGDRQAALAAYDEFVALQREIRQDTAELSARISEESP